jgi:hypothetical protein
LNFYAPLACPPLVGFRIRQGRIFKTKNFLSIVSKKFARALSKKEMKNFSVAPVRLRRKLR